MGELTRTISGNLASFRTAARVPIKNLKVHFTPLQQGTGDPSPTNVRNIVAPTGVTAYRDTKKVVWNQWLKPLTADNWKAYSTHNSVSFSNQIATSEWLDSNTGYSASISNKVGTLQSEGQIWYVSYMVKPSVGGLTWGVEFCGGRQNTCIQNAEANVWQQCSSVDSYRAGTRNYVYISYCRSIASEDRIGIIAQNKSPILINLTQMFGAGNEPTKEEFETQCLLNGIDLTQYHEYNEGIEIGWITNNTQSILVTFPTVGKNLFDTFAKGYYSPSREIFIIDNINITSKPISVTSGTVVTISQNITNSYDFSFEEWESCPQSTSDMISSNCITRSSNITGGTKTYTVQNNCYLTARINVGSTTKTQYDAQIQLELGSTATSYEPYYPETVYGGYVDLITGQVWKTHHKIKLSECRSIQVSSNSTTAWTNFQLYQPTEYAPLINFPTTKCPVTCDTFLATPQSGGILSQQQTKPIVWMSSVDGTFRVKSQDYCTLTAQEFTKQFSNTEFVYELASPIKVATLTQQELKTFLNQNNIWANSGSVDVTYILHDSVQMMQARKRIILNSPHIATSSGSIANFRTDLASPLKSCKVSFLPVQEGTGNPSPTNVRAITGWTGLDGWRTGKNMAHVFGYAAKTVDTSTASRPLTNTYGTTINTVNYSTPDTSLVITQSQWPQSSNLAHYQNGYFCIGVDSLIFDNYYDFSFKITNITNNPLNANLSDLRFITPSGGHKIANEIIDNRLIFKNIKYEQYSSHPTRQTVDIRNCGMSFTLSEFMVTPANQSDGIFEPYQGTTIPVNWSSDGTVYGGYVDLVSGEVWAEWEMIEKPWSDWTLHGTQTNTKRKYANFTNLIIKAGTSEYKSLSNVTPYVWKWSELDDLHHYIGTSSGISTAYIWLPTDFDETQNVQVAGKLSTPILVTTFTPQQLKTLKGTNNIWSNTNGNIEIKYWTH